MASISLQQGIIYGPVLSRRFGRSFGINLLPASHKVCSFDCRYCEYGKTLDKTMHPLENILPAKDLILEEVKYALKKPRTIETLTFSGNGEPTLHPEFLGIVRGVKKLRDVYRPKTKIALLSNSSCLDQPEVVEAIQLIDLPMMKLDAGDETTFRQINQPANGITFEAILSGLASLSGLMIQTMLIDGEITNSRGQPFESLVQALIRLSPDKIQLYSLERPTVDEKLIPVSPFRLQQIEAQMQNQFSLNAEAFWRDQ